MFLAFSSLFVLTISGVGKTLRGSRSVLKPGGRCCEVRMAIRGVQFFAVKSSICLQKEKKNRENGEYDVIMRRFRSKDATEVVLL